MSWLIAALLGGFVGLDATSFPQVMISRPVVAGVLTGVLFGRPAEGLAVGFLVEAFSLIILPIGAARYPDSGTATVTMGEPVRVRYGDEVREYQPRPGERIVIRP